MYKYMSSLRKNITVCFTNLVRRLTLAKKFAFEEKNHRLLRQVATFRLPAIPAFSHSKSLVALWTNVVCEKPQIITIRPTHKTFFLQLSSRVSRRRSKVATVTSSALGELVAQRITIEVKTLNDVNRKTT